MKIKYFGHSCFQVIINDKIILFDPFISPNELASDIDITEIHPDYVLLTHGHQDHMADLVTIFDQGDSDPLLVSNYELVTYFGNNGIGNGYPLNHGGAKKFDFGKVQYVSAVHSSSLPDGTYGGNPGGFVITSDDGNFYNSGDTALTYDMKLIGESTKLDFAILCIGDNFTMGVEDAIKAADFIKCDKIIGAHYDTFDYIKINHEEAIQKFANAGKELILMNIGEERNMAE